MNAETFPMFYDLFIICFGSFLISTKLGSLVGVGIWLIALALYHY